MEAESKVIELSGVKFVARELVMREIRNWFSQLTSRDPDVVNDALFTDFGIDDLAVIFDVPVSKFDALTPSELEQLSKLGQNVNQHFFGLLSRLARIGRETAQSAQ